MDALLSMFRKQDSSQEPQHRYSFPSRSLRDSLNACIATFIYIFPSCLVRSVHHYCYRVVTIIMGSSKLAKALGLVFGFATFATAQVIGELKYDQEETMVITISNPTMDSFSMIGSNDLFDQFNEVPYQPIQITNVTGAKVTLNGTRYKVPPLTDEAFFSLPPNGEFRRAINMSNYLLGPPRTPENVSGSQMKSVCFVAALPSSLYGVNTTNIESDENLAKYYLTNGLMSVKIASVPIHFNYSIPVDFTTDQAKYIEADAAQRAQEAAGTIGLGSGSAGVANTASRLRRIRRSQS